MRGKNNYLVAVANNGRLCQRFTPGVPRIFDQDCTYISFKVILDDEVCFVRLASIRCNFSATYFISNYSLFISKLFDFLD